MSDLTEEFDLLLKQREAPPTRKSFSVDQIEEFLKKAYTINENITDLHTKLSSIRQAYLSTAAPRKTQLARKGQPAPTQPTHLTDREREEIDAQAKIVLRELNASIHVLTAEESRRQATAAAVLKQKYGRGIGAALGGWAAGGLGGTGKSAEYQVAEEGEKQVSAHRESVMWFLRQRLQTVVTLQQGMMETRLTREMEKNRSVLAKTRPQGLPVGFEDFPDGGMATSPQSDRRTSGGAWQQSRGAALEEEDNQRRAGDDLTDEQRQMFEQDNRDMLKHYQTTLDKVRTAEKSLLEISELQGMLVNNLAMQSAHIDQLVADSLNTTENVGGGNKQLKKATERSRPAQWTFYAASGLCATLIIWDLIF
ncbi:putative t-snare protein [Phaeoacremonium minimum UCRPA7]|uniref:Putative t-snare protein n=1 Tax=Phaeoacremonium minimum (strain UCR-PA7) TaxID=1286976 RepID=R8BWQ3_PHAM7|nr:putative t-snare protein [Phaeoacremonium minimum UCRPA7]EOO03772.1 putative t-snare protein [Phaeoacremonium minimum UCRPA7]